VTEQRAATDLAPGCTAAAAEAARGDRPS
jgi:hypothetical protein